MLYRSDLYEVMVNELYDRLNQVLEVVPVSVGVGRR